MLEALSIRTHAIIIFVATVVISAFIGGVINGARWEKKFLKLEKESAEALAKSQAQARKVEQDWAQVHDTLKEKHDEETKRYKTEIASLRNSIRAGGVRLSVPAAGGTMPANSAAGNSEKRCYIDATTAERLIDIAESGDDAIRELNLCIDKYNALRK